MSDRKLQREPVTGASSAAWMLTFADLLSLLLTFFVLLFSMSTIEFESWKSVVQTMSNQFNPTRIAVDPTPHTTPDSLLKRKIPGLNQAYLTALIQRTLSQDPLFRDALVHKVKDNVVISIPASYLFENKSAVPEEDGARALMRLAGTLVQIRNRIVVAGHTNSDPIKSGLFRSNWELSLAQARIASGIMADAGYREPITVLGYADTRFHELSRDLGDVRRYQLAERIDIIIINEKRERGLYDLL